MCVVCIKKVFVVLEIKYLCLLACIHVCRRLRLAFNCNVCVLDLVEDCSYVSLLIVFL